MSPVTPCTSTYASAGTLFIIVSVVAVMFSSAGARPLSYSTVLSRSDGTTRSLTFSGSVEDGHLTGTLDIDGVRVAIDGAVTSGLVSGAFRWPGGTIAGEFSGKISDDQLRGRYLLDGATGPWAVPLSRVPPDVRALIDQRAPGSR